MSASPRSMIVRTGLSGSLLTIAMLAGCQQHVSYSEVRHNLTPEMRGFADTVPDAQGWNAYMTNMNSRMFNDDWNRAWYWDHPSRLDPRPVVDISGNPR